MAERRPFSLRALAVGWLAQREYSIDEMRRKLLRRLQSRAAALARDGATTDAVERTSVRNDGSASDQREVDDVISWLLASGYLDEARFVASRVHVRAAGHGLARISSELSRHGVAMPADTARELRDSEFDRALAIWQRRFGEPAADARGAARQARFLAGRGFSAEVVGRILRAARLEGQSRDGGC
ncbi:regulatory protein RecX [Piscinibacter sakaiensis]|uniref:regulatory protein RecX n=1 Tax=Piscinibacter sakaiensis TaxID=1547922 RepID=UPI003AABA3BA